MEYDRVFFGRFCVAQSSVFYDVFCVLSLNFLIRHFIKGFPFLISLAVGFFWLLFVIMLMRF